MKHLVKEIAVQSLLNEIKNNHGNNANLVITGDLSSDYSKKSYENIKTSLKQYDFKISLLPGNHDDLKIMKDICDDQIFLDPIKINNSNFIAINIDTHVQDNVQGYIKENELEKIENKIIPHITIIVCGFETVQVVPLILHSF